MTAVALQKPGTYDFATAYLNGALLSGVTAGWGGPYAGVNAITLDPTLSNGIDGIRLNTSAATTFNFTFANTGFALFDGQRLRIFIANGSGAAITANFPNSVAFRRNVGPSIPPTPGVWGIELRWDDNLALWIETSRWFTAVAAGTPLVGGWQNITLNSPWSAIGPWQTPQFRLDPSSGMVYLRGVAFNGSATSANSTLGTLPAGFRPPTNDILPIVSTANSDGLSVDTAGVLTVRPAIGTSGFVALSGARFSVDA